MYLKAVTFDFWNTLAHDRAPVEVRQIAAEKMVEELINAGFDVHVERMMQAFSLCRNVCFEYQEERGIDFTPENQIDWICIYLRINIDRNLKSKLLDYYTKSLLEIPPVFAEGLEEILKGLRERPYKLAIICNTGRTPGWVIKKILTDQGLMDYFHVTSFSNEMRIAKPNPKMFLITADKLEVSPRHILHVGDDIYTDVEGACKAGFKTAWFNPNNLSESGNHDIEIKDLYKLLDL